MKQHPSDVEPILRWRDRPQGGSSGEDRAAALARDAIAPDGFPIGLDDRRLLAIAERLKAKRRARPPFWVRPALVATLLLVSVTSVLGYQAGWFAPLREHVRFRLIPAAAPEPVEHRQRYATHSQAARSDRASEASDEALNDPSPARADTPVPEVEAAGSARPRASAPVAPHPPSRRMALADKRSPSPPPPAVERAESTEPSEELQTLQRAMELLRGKHDARAALAALDDYLAHFPGGVLTREARVARVDALLMLGRAEDALQALEALPFDAHRRSTELQLIRGELRARTDCGRGEADFTAVLARVRTAALEERALYGRAACRNKQGNTTGATDDLRRYLDRFPNGAHADRARLWLHNNLGKTATCVDDF